jgi:hypothetical protein
MNMNMARLFALGYGIVSLQRNGNVFRPTQLSLLAYLLAVKPVDLFPVRPALDVDATPADPGRPLGRASRIEAVLLRSLGALFVLAILACGFGVQRIAYVREKNRLGRELRRTELDFRALTQTYRSLEAEKSLELAQRSLQPLPQPAKADSIQQGVPAKVSRTTVVQECKSAPTRAGGAAFSGQRTHVADGRHPTRRNRIAGR